MLIHKTSDGVTKEKKMINTCDFVYEKLEAADQYRIIKSADCPVGAVCTGSEMMHFISIAIEKHNIRVKQYRDPAPPPPTRRLRSPE